MKFERGLNPNRAMNIGDLEKRKAEEQEEATREVENTFFETMGAMEAFSFFEKKLGKVHWAVIEYRKMIVPLYSAKQVAASRKFDESGALKEICKRLSENKIS